MRISAGEVTSAFRDLMTGARSREEIAAWAAQVRAADDDEGIEYVPPKAETAIWDALEFLMGVDLKDGPTSYLHNESDFEQYWVANKKELI